MFLSISIKKMNNHYQFFEKRRLSLCSVSIWLILLLSNGVFAQNKVVKFGSLTLDTTVDLHQQLKEQKKSSKSFPKLETLVFDARLFQEVKDGTAMDVIHNLPLVRFGKRKQNRRRVSVKEIDRFIVLFNGKTTGKDITAYLNELPDHAVKNIEVIAYSSSKYDARDKIGIINIAVREDFSDGLVSRFHIQGATALDVLYNHPLVSENIYQKLSIRGMPEFGLLLNGKVIQSDAIDFLSQLPASAVQDIELISNPSTKYDSNGKGGLVNIITRNNTTNSDSLYVQTNINAGISLSAPYEDRDFAPKYGADIMLNKHKDKWYFSGGLSFQQKDMMSVRENTKQVGHYSNYETLFIEENQLLKTNTYSSRLMANYKLNRNSNLSMNVFVGESKSNRNVNVNHIQNIKLQDKSFALGMLNYTKEYENQSTLSVSSAYEFTNLNHNLENERVNTIAGSSHGLEKNNKEVPLNAFRLQADYKFKPFSFGALEVGYQFKYYNEEGNTTDEYMGYFPGRYQLVGENNLVLDSLNSGNIHLNRSLHSAYVQLAGSYGKFDYNIGGRLEAINRDLEIQKVGHNLEVKSLNEINLLPSIHLTYNLVRRSRLVFDYTQRRSEATLAHLNPLKERDYFDVLYQGNPHTSPMITTVVSLNFIKFFRHNHLYIRTVINTRKSSGYVLDIISHNNQNSLKNSRLFALNTMELGGNFKVLKHWSLSPNILFNNLQIEMTTININNQLELTPNLNLEILVNYTQDIYPWFKTGVISPSLRIKKKVKSSRSNWMIQWLNISFTGNNNNKVVLSRTNTSNNRERTLLQETNTFMFTYTYNINK